MTRLELIGRATEFVGIDDRNTRPRQHLMSMYVTRKQVTEVDVVTTALQSVDEGTTVFRSCTIPSCSLCHTLPRRSGLATVGRRSLGRHLHGRAVPASLREPGSARTTAGPSRTSA